MKRQHIGACIFLSSLLSLSLLAEQLVTPYYSTRSQGRNAARNAVGWTNHIYQYDMDSVYASIAITPEYTRSFRHKRINRCLFGNNLIDEDESMLTISGTRTANRGDKDLLADYFYLPTDFKSTVQFKPLIDNFLVDFSFYLGLDEWREGLYFFFHAPLAHTRWDTNISEQVTTPGVNRHDAGYFTPDNNLLRNQLLKSFQEFAAGATITDVPNITFQGLRFAKISSKRLNRTRLAEIRTGFGWNFWLEADYHVGVNAQFALPTGSRPEGRFLFEPTVGNGHHWEAGVGINGHYTFWRSNDESTHASFHADANITHLFKARQKRTFDLKRNGTLSRYMTAMKMGTPVEKLFARDAAGNGDAMGAGAVPNAQFKNEFLPVANITNLNVDVRVGIQADIVAMFNVTSNGFAWDIGYNYWGRSCERIKLRKKDTFPEKTFALKGDARVFGFAAANDADANVNQNDDIALSATQSKATIHKGTNLGLADEALNGGIDTPRKFAATGTTNNAQRLLGQPNAPDIDANQQKTSNPAVFITESDVNLDDARTKGSSCKVFTHFSYTWHDKEESKPYLGIGGEVEFDHSDSKNCDECAKCSASQWGIWVKGGVTFD